MIQSLITYQVKNNHHIFERSSHAYIFTLDLDFVLVKYNVVVNSSGVESYQEGFALKKSSYVKAECFAKAQAEEDGYQFLKLISVKHY